MIINKIKKNLAYLITITLGIVFIFVSHQVASQNIPKVKNEYIPQSFLVEVVSVTKEEKQIKFDFFFTAGKDENKHTATQDINEFSKNVNVGDKVFVVLNDKNYVFSDFQRMNVMIYLVVAFLILILIFARFKGFNTIISLIFTLASLFYVLLPAILSQYNVYLWGFICSSAIVVFTLIVVHGANLKSLASGIGTLLGISFAIIIILLSSNALKFTGLISDEAVYLAFNNAKLTFDVKAIFFMSIIIGALGAIMDVAMSIATAIYEIKTLNPDITKKEMYHSGMEIGRDILGTMANTLILAYLGSGFLTIIVIVGFNTDLYQIFNKEFLIAQFYQPLIGSFGIVATLPLTAFISAYLYQLISRDKLHRN